MATWKKIVLAKGTSSQYIKGDGSFATYSDGVGLGDNNTWTGINTFSGALNPYIYINDTNGAKGIFQAYDTYVNIGSDSNHETRIVQNNATAITIDTSKNATFAGELDVNPATNKRIKFTFPTDEYANESRIGFSDLNAHITYKAQNNFMEMWSYNSLFLQTGSSATTALTLDSSQNATFAGSGTFGGQVKVTSSNASTVALSVGDAGTGWYNTGSNSIGLSINGTQKFNVDNAGNATFTQGVDGDAYIALDNVAGAGSSVNETAALRLNLGDGSTIRGGAKITAKKEADFSTGANMDSSLTLSVLQNNAFNDALIISSAGNVEVNTGALKIKTAGQELQWVNGATKLTGADTYLEFNVNSARRFKLDANS